MASDSYSDFYCPAKGKNSHAQAIDKGLSVGYYISINGSKKIQDFIEGDDDATIYSIKLEHKGGIFKSAYRLVVDGKGPDSGWYSPSNIKLTFNDASGDSYTLRIINSSRKEHVLDFDSDLPDIISFTWS